MNTGLNIEDAWKENLLREVRWHREHCNTRDCGVSLLLLRQMAEKAGVKFTDEERQLFF